MLAPPKTRGIMSKSTGWGSSAGHCWFCYRVARIVDNWIDSEMSKTRTAHAMNGSSLCAQISQIEESIVAVATSRQESVYWRKQAELT